jgi:excisionase family DNA binding protein
VGRSALKAGVAVEHFTGEMKTLKKPKNEAISVREVSKFLKLHRETVNRMIKSGELPALKVGTAFRLNRVQIVEWAKSRRARMQPED